MTGLVFELQRDSLNSEIRVSSLLRKALVISKKLKIIEIEKWLNEELDGYLSIETIPKYRVVRGQVKTKNPFHGWQPLIIDVFEVAEKLSIKNICHSIRVLESLSESNNGTIHIPFPSDIENFLRVSIDSTDDCTLPISWIIEKTTIVGILNAVRNNILNWSLELEKKGILGERMSFSNEEKKLAGQVTYSITNNIGSMHNSQLQQNSSGATQSLNIGSDLDGLKKFVEELRNSIENLKLQQDQIQELQESINTLEIQASSSKPKDIIIDESLRTVRNILEGTTGSIVASGLIYQLGLFLPS